MPHKVAWAVAAGGIAFLGIALVASQLDQGPAPSPSPPGPTPPGPTPTPQPPGPPAPGASCVPITLSAAGPGSVSGCGGQARNSFTQLCPAPGEQCVYSARPDPGAQFVHWAGPNGVTATQNPITLSADSPGFVTAFFGPGSGPPGPPPPPPPSLPPCPRQNGYVISNGQPGSRVYIVDSQGRKEWIPSGAVQAACLIGPGGVTTCDVDAVPTGPDLSWPGCLGQF